MYPDWVTETTGVPPVSAGAAQNLLTAIASAMITVTGVIFSITMVTLSIASSQFGPRLLRTFMSSKATQISLGVFLGTSVYCLLVMAQIRAGNGYNTVPQVSVYFGVLFMIFGMVFLIYYIHSIASLIQASNVVQSVALELEDAVDRLYPDRKKDEESESDGEDSFEKTLSTLNMNRPNLLASADFEGYLQAVDRERLLQMAMETGCFFAVPVRTGDYIVHGADVVMIWPDEGSWNEEDCSHLLGCFIVGNRPTPRQDIECCMNELVEVAVRALSPGINDPMTALSCIERISSAVGKLAERQPRKRFWEDEGSPRLLVKEPTFSDIVETGFTMIRQYGHDSASIMIRLLCKLGELAKKVHNRDALAAIEKQVNMIMNSCEKSFLENEDIQDARSRFEEARQRIGQESASSEG